MFRGAVPAWDGDDDDGGFGNVITDDAHNNFSESRRKRTRENEVVQGRCRSGLPLSLLAFPLSILVNHDSYLAQCRVFRAICIS